MKKSPVAGISGSIRVVCLTGAELTAAEKHGKRLDTTSQARAISHDPPVTSTGLELRQLYKQHVSDAFVHKSKNLAKHIIVQFPKDLVDGEDAEYMLRHARQIVEGIFGDQAIFADRVDRDEKGRHIVDVFVAPKYIKTTKHTSRLAVTLTRHEEELAEKHGRKNSPYGRGRAAQDELFEYFRDVMKLPDVQRGNPKTNPGPDWLHAEELREAELEEKEAALKVLEKRTAQEMLEARDLKEQAAADRAAAKAEREAAKIAIREAELESQRTLDARRDEIAAREARVEAAEEAATHEMLAAEFDRRMAGDERSATDRECQRLRHEARQLQQAADADRQRLAELRTALDAMRADIARDREEAAKAREGAEDARCKAAEDRQMAYLARVASEAAEKKVCEERAKEQAQIALLSRAADDDAGLQLRLDGRGFRMNEEKMTTIERRAYQSTWSNKLIAIARNLALFLERMRDRARQLLAREKEIDKRAEAVAAREREAAIQNRVLSERRAAADAQIKEVSEDRSALEAERRSFANAKAADAEAKRLIQLAEAQQLQMDNSAVVLRERAAGGSHVLHRIDALPLWSQEVLRGLGHFQHQVVRVSSLEASLEKRLGEIAIRYPERAAEVMKERDEVQKEVRKVFVPPQVDQSHGL